MPRDSDWGTLVSFVSNQGYNGEEGKALKYTSSWDKAGNGTANFNFDGKPVGYRKVNREYDDAQDIAYWWKSIELPNGEAFLKGLGWGYDNVSYCNNKKQLRLSVICIKN